MEHYLFKQLRFIRESTIRQLAELDEEASVIIPQGFNNHIKWNAGHIYVVQEKFAFQLVGEKTAMPGHFAELFAPGTKPADWGELEPPPMRELIRLLEEQVDRIEYSLPSRLKEAVEPPYTTSTGFTLSAVEQLLSFCLYHEGMHFHAIKVYNRLLQK